MKRIRLVSILIVVFGFATARADTSAPAKDGGAEILLPGWKKPVRFGMSMDEVRAASPEALEAGRCQTPCLVHAGDYLSDTDPINYWITLRFTPKQGLAAISLSCNSTEGCGDEHPLYRFWDQSPGGHGDRTMNGIRWVRYASVGKDSGDLSEELEISIVAKPGRSRR